MRNEFHDQLKQIEVQIDELQAILSEKMTELGEKTKLVAKMQQEIENLEADVTDKTKVWENFYFWNFISKQQYKISFKAIKILNQRLFDVKKTLQEEIKNNTSGSCWSMSSTAPAILIPVNVDNNNSYQNNDISGKIEMDQVKFSYLKHVVLKFLTSREFEAKHLIRAISTLLYLNETEEKLLYDTLEYRRSWFGAKPNTSIL